MSMNGQGLNQRFDAVVMLTASDWFTEMRSNRYHYATRFAKHLPVIFVQPDLNEMQCRYEESGTEGVTVLHACEHWGWKQARLLAQALASRQIVNPLLWVYHYGYRDFIALAKAPGMIVHATEDYFSPELGVPEPDRDKLKEVLSLADLLVAVSEGVLQSYRERGGHNGEALVIGNGCDFQFWAPTPGEREALCAQAPGTPVALYQGGIHRKVDFTLLQAIVRGMPDWGFWFCGVAYRNVPEWEALCRYPNVTYHGQLSPEGVRALAFRATVGLIPFVQSEWITQRAFPLKAFEYVACGLPVVSVPIAALRPYPAVITFAATAAEFIGAMKREAPTRWNAERIDRRVSSARPHDYDLKFASLLSREPLRPGLNGRRRETLHARYCRYSIVVKSVLRNARIELALKKRALISSWNRSHGSAGNL